MAFYHPINKVAFTFGGMHFNYVSERISRRDCLLFFILSFSKYQVLSFALLNVTCFFSCGTKVNHFKYPSMFSAPIRFVIIFHDFKLNTHALTYIGYVLAHYMF